MVEATPEYVWVDADNEDEARKAAKEVARKQLSLYSKVVYEFEVENASNT